MLSLDVSVDYPGKPDVLRGANLEVLPGEILGLVGQSGSGKSTLALAILRLLGHSGATIRGKIALLGRDLSDLTDRQMREVRGRIASLIPQSPAAALNPMLRIETQMREAWYAHSRESWTNQGTHLAALMAASGLPMDAGFLRRFPSQISVGQAQRVLIVMALLHSPALLIADEATSALDLITQREVLDLIARINAQRQMSVLFISHDLMAVAALCHRIAILHEGSIVECGPVEQVLGSPRHPYTQRLIASVPKWE